MSYALERSSAGGPGERRERKERRNREEGKKGVRYIGREGTRVR